MNTINSNSNNQNWQIVSLEQQFDPLVTQDVDIHFNCHFDDFLKPNENSPEAIASVINQSEKGIMVSTGTERCLFNLIFIDEQKCEGLVGRDINHRVKAYLDFNILLLRISQSREEYVELSNPPENINDRMKLISEKIFTSDIPDKLKKYYNKNLNDFSVIYYGVDIFWKKYNCFPACRYDLDNSQFSKLQRYAKAGNIISTIGNINDLSWFHDRKISVIDTSNITDSYPLNFNGLEQSPLIIWTQGTFIRTIYNAYIHVNLTKEQLNEFHQLFDLILKNWHKCKDKADIRFYSLDTLVKMRDYVDKNLIDSAKSTI